MNMKKHIITIVVGIVCTVLAGMFLHQAMLWQNEVAHKKIRANCAVNFERLGKIFFATDNKLVFETDNVEDCFDILQIDESLFLPLHKNKTFAEGLECCTAKHSSLSLSNESYPLFFDKKDIHGNGMRHVLMSNGRIYFLAADEFQKLQQNVQGSGD